MARAEGLVVLGRWYGCRPRATNEPELGGVADGLRPWVTNEQELRGSHGRLAPVGHKRPPQTQESRAAGARGPRTTTSRGSRGEIKVASDRAVLLNVSPYVGFDLYVRGPLAQLAEQRTFNPRVVGSSPTGPTE